jgi:hypothetical protein
VEPNSVTVDLVTRREDGALVLYLVEEGPWEADEIDDNLLALRERLLNLMEAVVTGAVAKEFPESKGGRLVVRLDAYDLPDERVTRMFEQFSSDIRGSNAVREALAKATHAAAVNFELKCARIPR